MTGTGIRTDISQEQVLMQQNFQVIFGDPQERVEMIGDIDGSNADFTLDDYPIYPERKYMITPDPDDMLIELCKGTTYTPATVTAFKTVTDSFGDTVNGGVTLSSAPASANVDHVYATYVHQFQPVIIQSFEPKVDQKVEEISGIGTDQFIYGYEAIKTSIKSTMISSANSVEIAKKVFSTPAVVGSNPVETGFDASTFSKTPKRLYAFMAITDPQTDELLGFYKFEECMVKPDILGIKSGKAAEFTIEFTVGAQPVLLTPQIAGSSLALTELTMTPHTAVTATPITNMTAVLEESNGNLIAGEPVIFYVDGDVAGTATTNSSGIATLATYTPSPALSAGSYPLIAEYAGDSVYAGSHGHSVIVITAS